MRNKEEYVATDENREVEPQAVVYIEQLLESIDSNELSRFLSEELRPAGFDEEELQRRFFSPDQVTTMKKDSNFVAWADGRQITFEPNDFFRGVKNFQAYIEEKITPGNYHDREVQFYEIAKIQLLHVFIHEQLHHLTFTNFDMLQEKRAEEIKTLYTRRLGIERQVIKAVQSTPTDTEEGRLIASENSEFFRGLNEGLTELMAQELTVEYMRQHALVDDLDVAREFPAFLTQYGSYKSERLMVEQLAAVFAEMTEVPYDIMLKSFYHEYVTNGHLVPAEFKDVIAEYLPEDVDQFNIEAGVASLVRSMRVESFEDNEDLAFKLRRLISYLPENKAEHCQEVLTEIEKKYYPAGKHAKNN